MTAQEKELGNKLVGLIPSSLLEERSSDKTPQYFTTGRHDVQCDPVEIDGNKFTPKVVFWVNYMPYTAASTKIRMADVNKINSIKRPEDVDAETRERILGLIVSLSERIGLK